MKITKIKESGVYIGMLLNQESKDRLEDFYKHLGLFDNDIINGFENCLHTTIMFSPLGNPDEVTINEIKINVKAKNFVIYESQMTGKSCLVLTLESPKIIRLHNYFKEKYKLEHMFNTYNPHITLNYDFKGEIPNILPDFEIQLEKMYVKKLIYNTEYEVSNESNINTPLNQKKIKV